MDTKKKINMDKLHIKIHYGLSIAVLALLLYAISGIIINYDIPGRPGFSVPFVFLFTVAVGCVLAGIAFVLHKISTYRPKLLLPLILSLSFLILCYQAVFAILTYRPIGWDVGHVIRAATSNEFVGAYLYMYPSNFMLTFVMKVWLQLTSLLGISQVWASAVALNVLMVDLSIAVITVWAWKEHGRFFGSLILIYSILLVALSPNILIPYGHVLGILFLASTFASYRLAVKARNKRNKVICLLLFGFMSSVGFNMRPSVLIVVIAVAIISVLYLPYYKYTLKRVVSSICICVLGFALSQGLFSLFVKSYVVPGYDKEIEEANAVPPTMTAAFMVGLAHPPEAETYGGYYWDDVVYIMEYDGREARNDAIMRRTMDRLSRMGFGGLLRLWHYKYNWSLSDGTFYYGLEGDPFSSGDARETNGIRGFFQNFANPDALYYKNIHANYQQGFWLLTLILAAIGVWLSRKEAHSTWDVIMLFILGLSIYLVLFETRSRYVFLALPMYIALACHGVSRCVGLLSKRIGNREQGTGNSQLKIEK